MPLFSSWSNIRKEKGSPQYGLIPLEKKGSERPPKYTVDIIAVHGLGGDPFHTWTHQDGTLWLRDMLPDDVQSARIFTFGYDAEFVFSKGTGTLKDKARSLLQSIATIRSTSEERSRPLIFLCHSMGGIVTKRALILARNEPDHYPHTLSSPTGILFFGTPHRGASIASYAAVLTQLANIFVEGSQLSRIIGSMRTNVVNGLKISAPELLELADDFRAHTQNIHITSFIEQKTMSGLNKPVVDGDSASVGVSNERKVPMEGCDHREICRHNQRTTNYKNVIWAITESLQTSSALAFPPYHHDNRLSRFQVPRDAISAQIEEQLALSDNQKDPLLVLLHGLPGSGKTRLARAFADKWILGGRVAVWFDASSASCLNKDFLSFAVSAKLRPPYDLSCLGEVDLRMVVMNFIADYSMPWLLVFDNYDTLEEPLGFDIAPYLPLRGRGSILITSRNARVHRALERTCPNISVGGMTGSEARALLLNNLERSNAALNQHENGLVTYISSEMSSGLPLAITQAGAYIRNMGGDHLNFGLKLTKYIDSYNTHQCEILRATDGSLVLEYGKSILTTFDMSFEVIQKKNMIAARLLLLCAFFHFNGIQVRWFERASLAHHRFGLGAIDLCEVDLAWFELIVKSKTTGASWDDFSLIAALKFLADYALITLSPDFAQWDIHPIIHSWSHMYVRERFFKDLACYSKLAATVLTEVYDYEADVTSSQIPEIRLELYAHTDTWVRHADADNLLTHSDRPHFKPFTLLRLASWLEAPIQSLKHKSDHMADRLRILAMSSGLSVAGLADSATLRAMTFTVRWLCETYIIDANLIESLFDVYERLLPLAAVNALSPSRIDQVSDMSVMFSRKALCLGSRYHERRTETAKRGLEYIKAHQHELRDALRLQMHSSLLRIARSKRTEGHADTLSALKTNFEEAFLVLGDQHHVTLGIKVMLESNKQERPDSDNTESSHLASNIAQYGRLTRIQKFLLLNAQSTSITREYGGFAEANVPILKQQRQLAIEEYGKYGSETLGYERMILAHLIYQAQSRGGSIHIGMGTDRWKNREDKLVLPIEVALGYKIVGWEEELRTFWGGVLVQVGSLDLTSKRLDESTIAFKNATRIARDAGYDTEGDTLESMYEYLHNQLQKKALERGESLSTTVRRLSALWSILSELEASLSTDTASTPLEKERACLRSLQTLSLQPKQTLLFMIIQYFLIIIKGNTCLSKPFLHLETVKSFDAIILEAFGQHGPLYQRWKSVQAVCLRLLGLKEQADAAEDFLIRRTVADIPTLQKSEGHSLQSPAAQSAEPRIIYRSEEARNQEQEEHGNYATLSLESVARECLRRSWYSAEARIHEETLAVLGPILGFDDKSMISKLNLVSADYERMGAWGRFGQALDLIQTKTCQRSFRLFHKRMINEVARDLCLDKRFRAVAYLMEWLVSWIHNIAGVDHVDHLEAKTLKYDCFASLVTCYHRLGYNFNRDEHIQEMEEIEAYLESNREAMSDAQRQVLETKIMNEREARRKLLHGC